MVCGDPTEGCIKYSQLISEADPPVYNKRSPKGQHIQSGGHSLIPMVKLIRLQSRGHCQKNFQIHGYLRGIYKINDCVV